MENEHVQAVPQNVVTEVQALLNQIKTLLRPYVTPLQPSERHALPKMGEKSLAFVEKAHELAVENPAFVPSYLNITNFGIDFADAHGLWTIRNDANQVFELLDDTSLKSGSEAYQAALVFYNAVKLAASKDAPGAKAIYEDLKTRFPHGKRKSASEE